MSPLRQVSRFFGLLLIYYAFFLALWSWRGSERGYAAGFHQAGTDFFHVLRSMGSRWEVKLQPSTSGAGTFDSELTIYNRATGAIGTQPLNAHAHGYAPTTMLLTLILASPVSWNRRGWAMLWGLLLVHGWIAFGLTLLAVKAYCTPGTPLALYTLSPWMHRILAFTTEAVSVSTVGRYAVPVFFWVFATFRRDDWERFSGGAPEIRGSPQSRAERSKPRQASP